jgi:ParB family chromosome partitioning protein
MPRPNVKHGQSKPAELKGAAATLVTMVPIADIVCLGSLRRPIDIKSVNRLKKDIARSGMNTPIDVVKKKGITGAKYKVIAGAHRYEACKSLGKTHVPVRILTAEQAKGWEQAENLFRHLRALDESEAMVKYVAGHALAVRSDLQKGGKQPHDKGYSRIAKSTGWDHKRVADAYAHDSLAEAIKERARFLKVDDNRDFLNQLSKLTRLSEQHALLKAKHSFTALQRKKNKPIARSSKAKTKLSVAAVGARVTLLEDFWMASSLKKEYDRQPVEVQRQFWQSVPH